MKHSIALLLVAGCLAALAAGGADAGAPGPRPGAMTSYFGAFIHDLDGNKVEAVTFPRQD